MKYEDIFDHLHIDYDIIVHTAFRYVFSNGNAYCKAFFKLIK